MDLPLEILKDVSQAIPVQQGAHCLTWNPEVGFELHLNLGAQHVSFRFDYGESISDLKEQIEIATGIPLPTKQKGGGKKEEEKATVETPILNSIGKNASIEPDDKKEAKAPGPNYQIKGERTRRSGLLPRLRKFHNRSASQGSGAMGAIAQRNADMAEMRDAYGI